MSETKSSGGGLRWRCRPLIDRRAPDPFAVRPYSTSRGDRRTCRSLRRYPLLNFPICTVPQAPLASLDLDGRADVDKGVWHIQCPGQLSGATWQVARDRESHFVGECPLARYRCGCRAVQQESLLNPPRTRHSGEE